MRKRFLLTATCAMGACALAMGGLPAAVAPAQASAKTSIDYATVSTGWYHYAYNGKRAGTKVTVKVNGTTLKRGRDYSVSYQQMQTSGGHFSVLGNLGGAPKKVGTYRVVAKGKGRYTGSSWGEFQIVPKETTVVSVRGGKKSLTVTWRKQSKQVDGFVVRCFTATGKRHEKSVTVRGAGKTRATIKGLKSGRIYYVGVRPYKKVAGYTIQATATPQKPVSVR